MRFTAAFAVSLMLASTVFADLDTVTYVSHDGGGEGKVQGNLNAPGNTVILLDSDGGDMWNGGDQFIYYHDSTQHSMDFTATARIVGQTEKIDGRWGKTGIRASADLSGFSQFAMAQLAAGNDSQPTGSDPVAARIAGRDDRHPAADGGFEIAILDAEGNEVPNNTFHPVSTNPTWLSLSYDAETNAFVAGVAPDISGVAGEWFYSEPVTNVAPDGDGWYIGLAYSAHEDLNFDQVQRADALHGVTYDTFTLSVSSVIPEPASASLALFAFLGMLGFRRRR